MHNTNFRSIILLMAAATLATHAQSQPHPGTAQLEPKKAGVVRVGVMMPNAQVGPGSSPAAVGPPIRQTIMGYLTGPTVEVIPIAALLPAQADAEAAQKQCDYVVASSVTQKRGNSGGGIGFIKGAASMSSQIPMLGAAHGAAGAIAGAAPERF